MSLPSAISLCTSSVVHRNSRAAFFKGIGSPRSRTGSTSDNRNARSVRWPVSGESVQCHEPVDVLHGLAEDRGGLVAEMCGSATIRCCPINGSNNCPSNSPSSDATRF